MRSTAKVNNGQLVSYVDHGGPGPAVLLLHSYLMDADMFAPQVTALRDTAMDERGHGDTPADGPICLGTYDATEWQAKWRLLSGDHIDRVLTPLVERDGVLDRAAEIRCPALVLHGSADAAYSVDRAGELAKALPNAEPPVIIEGGAHFLSLTDAEAVNPHLRTFLDDVLGR